jgi:hypothetical protein
VTPAQTGTHRLRPTPDPHRTDARTAAGVCVGVGEGMVPREWPLAGRRVLIPRMPDGRHPAWRRHSRSSSLLQYPVGFPQTRQPVSVILQVIERAHHRYHIETVVRPRQRAGVALHAVHQHSSRVGPLPRPRNVGRHQIKQTDLVAHFRQPDGVAPCSTSNISHPSRRLREDSADQLLAPHPFQRRISEAAALAGD